MWQAGDILHTINDVDVYRRPANEVAKRLLGRPGTRVKLGYVCVCVYLCVSARVCHHPRMKIIHTHTHTQIIRRLLRMVPEAPPTDEDNTHTHTRVLVCVCVCVCV